MKKKIQEIFEKWSYLLGLRWWDVSLTLSKEKTDFLKDNGETVLARTWADWRYMKATILINYREIKLLDPEEIEKIIVHELCHVLVNEMREGDITHEERVVTTLTNAFLWTIKLETEQTIEGSDPLEGFAEKVNNLVEYLKSLKKSG
jgi:Fe-S cluster biosynthesis and repair protein YggX